MTKIEWTEATWNPIVGCSVVSPGCTNCYAMRFAGTRLQHLPKYDGLTEPSKSGPVWTGKLEFDGKALLEPLRWKKPRMVFANSMGDLFHEGCPDEWIDRVFAVMALCPQHTFQVLTKRSGRMREYLGNEDTVERVGAERWRMAGPLPALERSWPLPNVWLGVSVEDQRRADERIPDLLATPAAVRWISAEPLLGPVDLNDLAPPRPLFGPLTGYCQRHFRHPGHCDCPEAQPRLHWVVVGGESGKGARPMHPDWARSLRNQCEAADVPFFFKQWGQFADTHAEGISQILLSEGKGQGAVAWPDGTVGHGTADACGGPGRMLTRFHDKKRAGRELDGVLHDAWPERAA